MILWKFVDEVILWKDIYFKSSVMNFVRYVILVKKKVSITYIK